MVIKKQERELLCSETHHFNNKDMIKWQHTRQGAVSGGHEHKDSL